MAGGPPERTRLAKTKLKQFSSAKDQEIVFCPDIHACMHACIFSSQTMPSQFFSASQKVASFICLIIINFRCFSSAKLRCSIFEERRILCHTQNGRTSGGQVNHLLVKAKDSGWKRCANNLFVHLAFTVPFQRVFLLRLWLIVSPPIYSLNERVSSLWSAIPCKESE